MGRQGEALEALRQEARLALARDRSAAYGRSGEADVVSAWEACAAADPASEEAAAVLVRAYAAQGRQTLASATYRRCRDARVQLGLKVTPALEEVLEPDVLEPRRPSVGPVSRSTKEHRLVTVVSAEAAWTTGTAPKRCEDMSETVGGRTGRGGRRRGRHGRDSDFGFRRRAGGAVRRPGVTRRRPGASAVAHDRRPQFHDCWSPTPGLDYSGRR